MNILKEARVSAGLTQKDIADRAGISTQAILRYEQALYENPSEKIVNVISELTDLPPEIIIDKYHSYRVQQRADIYRYITPPPPIKLEGTEHPFATWRKTVSNRAVGKESRIAFCILLAIHPAVVAEYDGGDLPEMPGLIREALRDIGLSGDYIQKLEDLGRIWYERRA